MPEPDDAQSIRPTQPMTRIQIAHDARPSQRTQPAKYTQRTSQMMRRFFVRSIYLRSQRQKHRYPFLILILQKHMAQQPQSFLIIRHVLLSQTLQQFPRIIILSKKIT